MRGNRPYGTYMPLAVLRTSNSFSVEGFSLKSNESTWLKAPASSKKTTLRAFPLGFVFIAGLARNWRGQTPCTDAPKTPSPPNFSSSRRDGIISPMVIAFFISIVLKVVKEFDYIEQRPLQVLSAFHTTLFQGFERQFAVGRHGRARQ